MAWTGVYRFRIDHTKCGSANSTNFPVVITGTYSWLKTVANGGLVTSSSGYDIMFYSDLACTTALKFERVVWSGSTGVVEFWVKEPTLSYTDDVDIYCACGNSSITTDQQDKNNVYDANHVLVMHFGDGTTLDSNDSTSNANNGTASNVTAVSGILGGAGSYNGSSSRIDVGAGSSLDLTSDFTLSAWVYVNNLSTWRSIMGKQHTSGNPKPLDWYFQGSAAYDPPAGRLTLYLGQGTGGQFNSSTNAISTSTWQHVVVTKFGSSISHYKNGVANGTGTISYSTASGTEHLIIGSRTNLDIWMNGYIDEVQVSNTARSASWILAAYNNQSSPSTFYSVSGNLGGFVAVPNRRLLVPIHRASSY